MVVSLHHGQAVALGILGGDIPRGSVALAPPADAEALALADGCTDATVMISMERRRAPGQQSAQAAARQQGKVDRALAVMAEELGARNWCSGETCSLSDIAVGCSLGYLDLRLPDLNWRKAYPNLARLAERLAQRQSFKDTAPPPP